MENENCNNTGGAGNANRRPRTRAVIEAERRELEEKTRQEIIAIAADYHLELPREQAKLIGAMYARYSTRFQGSVADQVRSMFQDAVKRGIFVPLENIFFDLAVRGAKNNRQGLNCLRALLARRQTPVLLLFSTSRLFRRLHLALCFVDQVVKDWGVRCVFINSGIDTDDKKRWEMLLQMHGMIDQFSVTQSVDNVRAGHEGLLDRQHVHGTLPFGFTGIPVPGEFTNRNLPRRKIAIDPVTAPWVLTIFRWYGEEGLAIGTIVQRLNATPDVPLPPKGTTGMWTYLALHMLLANPRYRGLWLYGEKENTWVSSKDYTRQLRRPEPLRQVQIEELRIVSDPLWYAVQRRLAEEQRRNAGRKPKDGDRARRPRLLNGLFYCPEHDRPLQVGGAYGRQMFCPACRATPAERRPLYSFLNRAVALRLTCQTLARLLRQDGTLVDELVGACLAEAAAVQQPDTSRLAELRKQVDRLSQQIAFNLRNVGVTPEDQEETAKLLRELRGRRAALQAELAAAEAGRAKPVTVPTPEEARALIDDLGKVLTDAASGFDGAAGKAREVIKLLTGGRINLYQQGERSRHAGWLQGRFKVRLLWFLAGQALGAGRPLAATGETQGAAEVVIDYREQAERDSEAEQAKALYDQGLMNKEIATRLGCGRNYVTKLLQQWHAARGLSLVDGRQRRSLLPRKQTESPLYEQLAEPAKALWDEGLADVQIAARLNCSPPTAVAAVEFWHRTRSLEAPSHAARCAALVEQMYELYQQEKSIRDIAKDVGMCTRSVTLLLRERFAQEGKIMPDGRTRRWAGRDDSNPN